MTGDIYEQMARARRTPALNDFLDAFVEATGIEQDFVDSCNHPYGCSCQKCLSFWASMGPEDEEYSFGPFTREQVEEYCKENDKPIWW